MTEPTTEWNITTTTRLGVTYNVLSTMVGGTEYCMEQQTFNSFHKYLSFEIFRGSRPTRLIITSVGSGVATSGYDTAGAFAGLLLDKPKAEGMNGLKKLLLIHGLTLILIRLDSKRFIPPYKSYRADSPNGSFF